MKNLNEFEKVQDSTNLWKRDGKFYRLRGEGVTPNGCYRINPTMHGIADIDAATGMDVLTGEVISLDYGTVSAHHVCI